MIQRMLIIKAFLLFQSKKIEYECRLRVEICSCDLDANEIIYRFVSIEGKTKILP